MTSLFNNDRSRIKTLRDDDTLHASPCGRTNSGMTTKSNKTRALSPSAGHSTGFGSDVLKDNNNDKNRFPNAPRRQTLGKCQQRQQQTTRSRIKTLRDDDTLRAAPYISVEIKNPACAVCIFRREGFFKRKPVYSRREQREKYCTHTRGSAEVSDRMNNNE